MSQLLKLAPDRTGSRQTHSRHFEATEPSAPVIVRQLAPAEPERRRIIFDPGNVNAEWFLDVLRSVWHWIPVRHSSAILRHWQRHAAGPHVAVVEPPEIDERLLAKCRAVDGTIRLNGSSVRLMSGDFLSALLAHELAHSYRLAAGIYQHDRVLDETFANLLAEEWGFRTAILNGPECSARVQRPAGNPRPAAGFAERFDSGGDCPR